MSLARGRNSRRRAADKRIDARLALEERANNERREFRAGLSAAAAFIAFCVTAVRGRIVFFEEPGKARAPTADDPPSAFRDAPRSNRGCRRFKGSRGALT